MDVQVKKAVLANGTRVVLVPCLGTDAVTVEVLFGVGSRYEPAELNGAAHFIEHMMFKGTVRRPSATDIPRALDAVGAEYNAFTNEECTAYHIRLLADQLPLAVDILSDMVVNSLFREEDITVECGAIVEEARGYLDDSQMLSFYVLDEISYPGTSLGRPIIGTVGTIEGLNRERLVGFRDEQYVPANTVIGIAGKFDEAEVMRLVDQGFGAQAVPAKDRESVSLVQPGSVTDGPRVVLRKKAEAEQANVCIGFEAYGRGDPRLPALTVLNNVLGGTMSSRLFVNVRERRGLAYGIGSFQQTFHGTGRLIVYAGLSKDKLETAIGVIVDELAKLKADGITADGLQSAQNNIRGSAVLQFESSQAVGHYYGASELLNPHPRTIQEYLNAIAAVTEDDVLQVAREILRANKLCMAIVSPLDDPAPYTALAAKLG